MVTKVINTGDSSGGFLAVIAIILVLGIGFLLYSQGVFNDKADVNINLPNGKSISGSVSK